MLIDDFCLAEFFPGVFFEFLFSRGELEVAQRLGKSVNVLSKSLRNSDLADAIFRRFGFNAANERNRIMKLRFRRCVCRSVCNTLQPRRTSAR